MPRQSPDLLLRFVRSVLAGTLEVRDRGGRCDAEPEHRQVLDVFRKKKRPALEDQNPMLSGAIAKAHVLRKDRSECSAADDDQIEVARLDLWTAIRSDDCSISAS